MSEKISVIVNTLNEEANIRNCLESVKWADEIIVVDMYSDDRTREIAAEYTSKVFLHERMGYVEPARQFALEKATNEWILVVDADELVPLFLRNRLVEIVKENLHDAVIIPRANYFFGKRLIGAGWGASQDLQTRFYRKSVINYGTRIHNFGSLQSNARIITIEDNISFIHFNYKDYEHFIDKLNRYTTIEAKNDYEDGKSIKFSRLLYISAKEFLSRYFKFKGYKDGVEGFTLSLLMAIYRLTAGMKLLLMKRYMTTESTTKIIEEYQKVADQVNMEYLEEIKNSDGGI
jgi:glycosyltransferase involved in cell wall biosynthesis